MPTAQVLDEPVPSNHHARRSMGLQPAHRPEPCLQPAMVAFDSVVLVLAGDVQRRRNEVLDHVRQGRCTIGDDLGRFAVVGQGCAEELARSCDIPALGHVHVDNLPVLVHGRYT